MKEYFFSTLNNTQTFLYWIYLADEVSYGLQELDDVGLLLVLDGGVVLVVAGSGEREREKKKS